MYYKTKLSIIILIILFFILNFNVSLSEKPVIVIIKGKVIEQNTNKPIGATVKFLGSDGSSRQFNSNSDDGEYQQPVLSHTRYWTILKDYVVVNENYSFGTPNTSEFLEIEKNIIVKKINVGMALYQLNLFKPNDSTIALNDQRIFNELKEWMSLNKMVNLRVLIRINDSYLPPIIEKISYIDNKGKKKTKKVTTSTEDQLKELAKTRTEEIKKLFTNNNININLFKFSDEIKPAKAPSKPTIKGKKKTKQPIAEPTPEDTPDVFIQIEKILHL